MLIEKLSCEDKGLISTWIKEYGQSNRDYGMTPNVRAPLESVLRAWDENKSGMLWKMFGEQFILEREISYQKDDSTLLDELELALSDDPALYEFKSALLNSLPFSRHSQPWQLVRQLFYAENLKENRNCCNYTGEINLDETTSIKIPENAKVMKIFHKLAKYYHLESEFEKFRIKHSQILNQKLLTGTLCLSIHPFDYMTMSDNTYGWDSCMNWEENGCYRAGTVEMMNSSYVLVAYLKGSEPFRVWDYYWEGNKKWRELYIVHPKAICNIKGYPYNNEALSLIVLDWLRELAEQNLGWDIPDREPIHFKNDTPFLYHNEMKRYYFHTFRMYNDFNTGCTKHYMYIPKYKHNGAETINISGPNICVWCGEEWTPRREHEDHVICEYCDPGYVCTCCERSIDEDDSYTVEGDTLCEDCYADCAGYDPIDGSYYYNYNLITVYLAAKNDEVDNYDDLESTTIHIRNARKETATHYLNNYLNIPCVRYKDINGIPIYYVNIEDCTKCGLDELFGLWNEIRVSSYIERYEQLTS